MLGFFLNAVKFLGFYIRKYIAKITNPIKNHSFWHME